jgi:hypothetical protein
MRYQRSRREGVASCSVAGCVGEARYGRWRIVCPNGHAQAPLLGHRYSEPPRPTLSTDFLWLAAHGSTTEVYRAFGHPPGRPGWPDPACYQAARLAAHALT